MKDNMGYVIGLIIVLFTGFVVLDLTGNIDWKAIQIPGTSAPGYWAPIFLLIVEIFVIFGAIFGALYLVKKIGGKI